MANIGYCVRCNRDVWGIPNGKLRERFPSCNTCDDEDEQAERFAMIIRSLPVVQLSSLNLHIFADHVHIREGEMTL